MTRKLFALLTTLALLAMLPAALSEGVAWTCPTCHLTGITGRTCPRCATWRPEDGSADEPAGAEAGARWITDFTITQERTCSARVDWSAFAETHPGGYTLEWVYGENPDIRYVTTPETGTDSLIALAPGVATRVRVFYNPDAGADLSVTADPDPAREKEIPGDLPEEPPVDFLASRYEIGAYNETTGAFRELDRLGSEAEALFRADGSEQLAIRYSVRFNVTEPARVLFTWMLRSPGGSVYLGVESKRPQPGSPDVEDIYPLGDITREFLRYNDLSSGDFWLDLYAEGYPVCRRRMIVDLSGAGQDEYLDAVPTPTPTPVPSPGSYPGLYGETQPIALFPGGSAKARMPAYHS